MLRQVAARRRGRGLPLAWHSRPIGAAVHFLHTPSAAAASPAAASALSFVAPSPTPATPAHSRILRPSLILPSGVARAYTASNRPAAGEAAAAPASTSSESSSKVDLKTMLSRLDGPMPMAGDPRMLDCILVRHGESEGNIGQPGHKQKKRRVAVGSRSKQPAYNRSWEGDHSLYTGAFLKRHSSLWRLSDRGREQARTAGTWLRREIALLDPTAEGQNPIYRYYVSEYIRAMETAALMDLPDAKWFVEVQLRERDWGTFDLMSQKERVVRFSEETRRRDRDSLFYAPPGGESLVHVLSRVDGVLTNFNRQCANRRCIVVCHGEVMWAFRLRFERLSQLTYREMEAASSPYERIHNCQILWYSRRNPHTGEISPFFRWKRSVCPWDEKRSSNEWVEISRVEHTNDSLAAHVSRVKRIYGHEKSRRAVELDKAEGADKEGRPAMVPKPRPATPTVTDPLIAAELQSLKRDVPVLAAAAHAAEVAARGIAVGRDTDDDTSADRRKSSPSSTPAAAPLAATISDVDSQSTSASPPVGSAPAVWTPPPGWPFLSAHPRVLVLTKTPRYEHEKNSSGLRGQDLHAELSKLGFVSDRLVQSYVRHMEGLGQLTQALQAHAMKVIVKHVDSANRADLEGIDLIVSAGGDGTMLKAAALLGFQQRTSEDALEGGQRVAVPAKLGDAQHHPAASGDSIDSTSTDAGDVVVQPAASPPPDTAGTHSQYPLAGDHPSDQEPYVPIPLIGVNTDPQHSSGVLCAFSIEGPHTAERVIEHLRKSHFVWLDKSRIEITLLDKSGAVTLVPQYAYNDVVVAERDPGRPIVYELTVDDHPAEIQRSSGVLVCTGTGSTAWMANAAAIHPEQVAAVLKDIGHKHSPADARQIAERINLDLTFESNSPEVEYFVREPLLPLSSAAAIGRVGYQHRHGWAGRIAVRSLGWDAVMSIDGINLVRLPKGTTAVLQIGKKPGANLTVLSLAGTGGQPFSRQ